MHLPTEGLDTKWHRATKKVKKSVEDQAWAALSADEEKGRKAIADLEDGKGNVWFGLDGSKRLRYNLLNVHRMSLISVSEAERNDFMQCFGKKTETRQAHDSLQSRMGHDWTPSFSGERTIVRPFCRLQHLHFEAGSLADMYPTRDVYGPWPRIRIARFDDKEAFESLALLPLRPLAEEARLSNLRVDLLPSHPCILSEWHASAHVPFWDIVKELGVECDRYQLRGICDCHEIGVVIPRAPQHIDLTAHLESSHDHQFVFNLAETFYGAVIGYLDLESELVFPKSMLWKIESPDSNTGTPISLYVYQEQHPPDQDENDDAPRTCRQAVLESFNAVLDEKVGDALNEAALADDGYEYEFEDGENDEDEDFHPRTRQTCTRLLWRGATVENLVDELRRRIIVDLSGLDGEDMIEAVPPSDGDDGDDHENM